MMILDYKLSQQSPSPPPHTRAPPSFSSTSAPPPAYETRPNSLYGIPTPRNTDLHNTTPDVSPAATPLKITPPPSGFSRAPPRLSGRPLFPQMTVDVEGHSLDKGFPIYLPPTEIQPHPFVACDITEGDWARFIDDLRRNAALTGRQRSMAVVVPLAMDLGLAGYFMNRAMKKRMRINNRVLVIAAVDTWNHKFFHPRRVHVSLMRGAKELSGAVIDLTATDETDLRRTLSESSTSTLSVSTPKDNIFGSSSPLHTNQLASPSAPAEEDQGKGKAKRGKEKKDKTYRLVITPL